MKKYSIMPLLLTVPLTLVASPVFAKESLRQLLKELNTQVKQLKSQLQESNARINQLEKERQQAEVPVNPPVISQAAISNTTVAPSTTNTPSVTGIAPTTAAPVVATKTEKSPLTAGNVKGTFKVPGTETSLGFGGFVKTDVLFNSVSAGRDKLGDQQTVYAQIPLEKSPGEHSQITFHAKESRLWFRSFTPSSWGDINTYLEFDFFNDPATYSYIPRLRHAYGSIGNFLAGQTWTTFLNNGVFPDLLDVGGTAGSVAPLRQPQLRWTQPFTVADTQMELQLAVETPRSRIRNIPTSAASAAADYFDTPNAERYPDMVARLNFNPDWGSVSVAAMARQIRSTDATTGRAEQAWGGAVSVAGKINTVEQDNLRFMLNYGNVLGRYATTNTFTDAVINSSGDLALVNLLTAMFSYQHFWSKNWRSTAAYGFAETDQPSFVGNNMTRQAQSVHANLLWSPVSQTTFGTEYIYIHRDAMDGRDGDIHRVQFSARYNF